MAEKRASTSAQRDTFHTVREILKRTLDSLGDVRRQIEAMEPPDERDMLFAESLVRQRREIEDAVDGLLLNVQAELLETFVQSCAASNRTTLSKISLPLGDWIRSESSRRSPASASSTAVCHLASSDGKFALGGVATARNRRVALGLQQMGDV